MSEPTESPTPSRYRWSYRGVEFDFYRLCRILGINGGPQEHAFKKIIRAGRSIKPLNQEIDETIDALRRWKEMLKEDAEVVEASWLAESPEMSAVLSVARANQQHMVPDPDGDMPRCKPMIGMSAGGNGVCERCCGTPGDFACPAVPREARWRIDWVSKESSIIEVAPKQ